MFPTRIRTRSRALHTKSDGRFGHRHNVAGFYWPRFSLSTRALNCLSPFIRLAASICCHSRDEAFFFFSNFLYQEKKSSPWRGKKSANPSCFHQRVFGKKIARLYCHEEEEKEHPTQQQQELGLKNGKSPCSRFAPFGFFSSRKGRSKN